MINSQNHLINLTEPSNQHSQNEKYVIWQLSEAYSAAEKNTSTQGCSSFGY